MDFLSPDAIARATLLSERLAAARASNPLPPSAQGGRTHAQIDGGETVVEWARLIGGNDALDRRLAWSGIDPAAASAIAAGPGPAAPASDWPAMLHELRQAIVDTPPITEPASGDVPFIELLQPIAERAAAHLPISPLIATEAWQPSIDWLVRRLARIAAPTLLHLFEPERPPLDPLERVLQWDGAVPAPSSAYVTFVERLRAEALGSVFEAYPALARLITRVTSDWIATVRTLVARLDADRDRLAAELLDGATPRVTAARCGLSDPHRGGSTVWLLTFDEGTRIIYKPRSVALEHAWSALLRWCAESGLEPTLRAPVVVTADGYGWMEFVRASPAVDAAARSRLAERAGALLCLIHLLRGTDCHSDNIIADGDEPVLIDAETLLHPDADGAMHADYDSRMHDNVARTGFLPRWEWQERAGRAALFSGLGMFGPPKPEPVSQWEAVGTDWVRPRRMTPDESIPLADLVDIEALSRGFAAAYRHVLAHRTAFRATLDAFNAQPVRHVYRPTQIYDLALGHATRPASLGDGLRFGAALDALRRPFLTLAERPHVWPMLDEELTSLEAGDAPYFESRTDRVDLRTSHGVAVPRCFNRPSYARVTESLEKIGEQDLAFQLTVIRGSLAASRSTVDVAPLLQAPVVSTSPAVVDAARGIGERIVADVMVDHRGHARWMGLAAVPPTPRFQYAVLGEGLYDGNAGIALFLAALDAHLGGRSEYGKAAARALAPVRDAIDAHPPASIGATGAGGLVYALARVSRLLGDDEWLDVARRAALHITPDAAAADTRYDVMFGSAGAILGLLTLYREGDADALDRAMRCGRHLIGAREPSTGAWRTIAREPIPGFSHGQAGIALALLRLAEASGDDSFAHAALEACAHEDTLFDAARRNWPPYRVAWCHGAPGIVLARLSAPPRWRDALVGSNAVTEMALAATIDAEILNTDHVCCGTLGRSDILLDAARVLDRQGLADAAASITSGVLARADSRGGFALHPGLPAGSAHPGLFQGLAGVGYHLLRLATPSLPSVLAWD